MLLQFVKHVDHTNVCDGNLDFFCPDVGTVLVPHIEALVDGDLSDLALLPLHEGFYIELTLNPVLPGAECSACSAW